MSSAPSSTPSSAGGAAVAGPAESVQQSLTPGSARSLLFTVLGELVWPTVDTVWTGALVYVLGCVGVEEQTARQAISRAAASDWIHVERRGREAGWSLSPKLVGIFEVGSPRVYALSDPFTGWDGRWLAVYTTIPKERRAARRPLYAGLTWAGFGNPMPGLWVSPHVERAEEIGVLVEGLGLGAHTVILVGTLSPPGKPEAQIVAQGWDLRALADHYGQLISAIDALHPTTPDATLAAHVRMISEYRELPRTDPQLPEALLPDWVGRRAARRIEARRAQWTGRVRRRFAEINAACAPKSGKVAG